MARSAFLLGHMLAEFAGMVVAITILSIAGLIVGWRIDDGVPHALAGYGLMLCFALAMVWVGLLVGVSVRSPDAVMGIGFTDRVPADVRREHVRADRRACPPGSSSSPSGTRSARWPPRRAGSSATRRRSRTTPRGRSCIRRSTACSAALRSSRSWCRSRSAATARARPTEPPPAAGSVLSRPQRLDAY